MKAAPERHVLLVGGEFSPGTDYEESDKEFWPVHLALCLTDVMGRKLPREPSPDINQLIELGCDILHSHQKPNILAKR